MFNRILLPAILTGLLSALVLTLAQHIWITPLILQAETYEVTAQAHVGEHEHHAAMEEHHHEEAWQPAEGWPRPPSACRLTCPARPPPNSARGSIGGWARRSPPLPDLA